jgi:hypothetical protein
MNKKNEHTNVLVTLDCKGLDAGVFYAINALVFLKRKEVVLLYNFSSGPESG